MKSDISHSPRIRVEGRQSANKRRMAKASSTLENGDLVGQLTLPLQENFKYSKQSLCTRAVEQMGDPTHILARGDTMLCSGGRLGSKGNVEESKQLKELLLVHLDLIQQQQEMIVSRDRQIHTLRSERESLKCRLERMERRMSLLKQKGDSPSRMNVCLAENQSSSSRYDKQDTHNRGMKRKGSPVPHNAGKRFASSTASSTTSNIGVTHGSQLGDGRPSRVGRHASPAPPSIPDRERSRSQDTDSQPEQPDFRNCSRYKRSRKKNDTPERDFASDILQKLKPIEFRAKENVLRTENMYFVPYDLMERRDDDEEEDEVQINTTKPDQRLQVPTWRINPIPTGYQMEGTENLDDEIFLKRHSKSEQDEKRRKRWDMQRLREQKLYERLAAGRNNDGSESSGSSNGNFASLWPDPDNAKYIEVCESVPVSAFGFPLPDFSPSEFELPWFDVDKREREEKYRTNRKKR